MGAVLGPAVRPFRFIALRLACALQTPSLLMCLWRSQLQGFKWLARSVRHGINARPTIYHVHGGSQ